MIIGGSGTIGAEIGRFFYGLGWNLMLIGRDEHHLEQAKALIESSVIFDMFHSSMMYQGNSSHEKQSIRLLEVDLRRPRDAVTLIDNFCSKMELTALIFCAGSLDFLPLVPHELKTEQRILDIFRAEVESTALIISRLSRRLVENGATIACVSSLAAYASGRFGQSTLCAAASAKLSLMEALYEETRERGIRCTSILVDPCNSPAVDELQRHNLNFVGSASELIQPVDIARAVIFACSSRSAITELNLQAHVNSSHGLRVLSRALNEKAFPERPLAMRSNVPCPTAIVTGASKGIGLACALRLASIGFSIVLIARSREPLLEAVDSCANAAGVSSEQVFRGMSCDVGERGAFDKCMNEAMELLGRVDVLLCNAGTNRRRSAVNSDWNVSLGLIDTNFGHMLIASSKVMPMMIHQGGGTILFTSSRGGGARQIYAWGDPGLSAYYASKAALSGYAQSLFEDVRQHGVKIVQLVAGLVATPLGTRPMGNFKRPIEAEEMIQAEEIADQVVFAIGSSKTCCPTRILCQTLKPYTKFHRPLDSLRGKVDRRKLRLHSNL